MIISLLPMGMEDKNRSFPNTILRLKSNNWIELENGEYLYTAIVDGLSDTDIIAYELSPEGSVASEDELFSFNCITKFEYGINHIIFTASQQPPVNISILLYTSSYDLETLTNIIKRLSKIIDSATIEDIPNTLVLRDVDGLINGTFKFALNSKFATNDELGRNIIETYAPIDSPTFIGTPVVPYANEDEEYAIVNIKFLKDFVSNLLNKLDVMDFKGTIGTNGTVTELPVSDVSKGDTYKVVTDGTYAGYECGIGDLLIAIKNAPIQPTTDNWAMVPSGDDPLTTLRFSTDKTKVNILTTARTGDIIAGEAATKQVDSYILNAESDTSDNLPTTAAVKEAIKEVSLVNTEAIIAKGTLNKTVAGTLKIQTLEGYSKKENNSIIKLNTIFTNTSESSINSASCVIKLNTNLNRLDKCDELRISEVDSEDINGNIIYAGENYKYENIYDFNLNINDYLWTFNPDTGEVFSSILDESKGLDFIDQTPLIDILDSGCRIEDNKLIFSGYSDLDSFYNSFVSLNILAELKTARCIKLSIDDLNKLNNLRSFKDSTFVSIQEDFYNEENAPIIVLNYPISNAGSTVLSTSNKCSILNNTTPLINTVNGNSVSLINGYSGSISIDKIIASETSKVDNKFIYTNTINIKEENLTKYVVLDRDLLGLASYKDSLQRAEDNSLSYLYIDNGDWYIESKVGKLQFSENDNWIDGGNSLFSITFDKSKDLSSIFTMQDNYVQYNYINTNYPIEYDMYLLSNTENGYLITEEESTYTLYIRYTNCADLDAFKLLLSNNNLNILYKKAFIEYYKVSDKNQVVLANLNTKNKNTLINTNTNSFIQVSYPINKCAAMLISSYNTPQKIIFTLKDDSLSITN